MLQRKNQRKTSPMKVVVFPGVSSHEFSRTPSRRSKPVAVIPMPARKPEDVITQNDLLCLRIVREAAERNLRDMDNLEAHYANRIRSGATIEPGPERFTKARPVKEGAL